MLLWKGDPLSCAGMSSSSKSGTGVLMPGSGSSCFAASPAASFPCSGDGSTFTLLLWSAAAATAAVSAAAGGLSGAATPALMPVC